MLTQDGCPGNMLAIKDTVEMVYGKWKLLILVSLSKDSKRFKEISREVSGISDKMLSKELKDLEINKLVEKEVSDAYPSTPRYSITKHGLSLEKVMKELYDWGLQHRKEIMGH
jgi:DNA-binding HxlR family transcriptional regulator